MKNKKIKLDKLSVKSFQTSAEPLNAETLKGGRFHQVPETEQLDCATHSCISQGIVCTFMC